MTFTDVTGVCDVSAQLSQCSPEFRGIFGQDFYQTYARITGNQGFAQIFLGPLFGLKHRKISRKSPERPFFRSAPKSGCAKLW